MRNEEPFHSPVVVAKDANAGWASDALARQEIWETWEKLRRLCDIGQMWLENGDDHGERYTIKQGIIYMRCIASTFKERVEAKDLEPAKKSDAA